MRQQERQGGALSVRIANITATCLLLLVSTALLSCSTITPQTSNKGCQLNSPQGGIQHVIHIQFDNVHFSRDNPNIPSDLEQMPNLLNFIERSGTMLSNNHTALIAHTATNLLTTITGVYPDRHGVPVSNSFRYFNPDGSTNSGLAFAYWTAPLFDTKTSMPSDTKFNLLTAEGKNAPAPWVPYTRAGCNFGAAGATNTILENTGIDIPTVFGANSPEVAEAKANPKQALADFAGIGIHCAKGSILCSTANNGKSDLLPDEPDGYAGFMALFGYKYVAPHISPNGPLTDLNGNVIKDAVGNAGFPGFDSMSPAVSLAYIAAMQEHNVPVTYAYISDAHDNHSTNVAFGPGEAGYVAQLKTYDDAFGKFFARLAKDGINASNTLFVFTADEGDHFVGGAPNPADCNGVKTPCSYSHIGAVNANLTGLLATQKKVTTPFTVHADSAPTVYITSNPARNDKVVRTFEQAAAGLTATNPLTNKTDNLTNYLADPVEMKLLHMVTADAARTPTFTLFANPNYLLVTGSADCTAASPCVVEKAASAWDHGDVSSDINTTWLGLVGPAVRNMGVNGDVWLDHTDARPTMMAVLGLKDYYRHDGRVLFEVLTDKALSPAVRLNPALFIRLAQVYKQLNAPVGQLALHTLKLSTKALASNTPNDQTYTDLENHLQTITDQRNATATQIIAALETAEFGGSVSNQQIQALLDQGNALLEQVKVIQ